VIITRRYFSALAATSAFMSSIAANRATALAWPTRPVHLVVPFSAGGPTDVIARIVGERRWLRTWIRCLRVGFRPMTPSGGAGNPTSLGTRKSKKSYLSPLKDPPQAVVGDACISPLARYRTPIVAGQAAGWTNPPFDACRRERRPDHFRRWSCRPGTRDACSQPPAALKTVPMLVTLGIAARSGGMTVPSRCGSFALLWLLGSASSTVAQGPDDFLRTFGTITQPATVQATQAAWGKLPSKEIGCLNDALHQQGGSVEALIQRGVLPSDPRLANEQSKCQKQSERQEPQPIGSQRSVYAVRGVALGATVPFGSSAYREYECGPSDQFDGFTWCQKTRKEKERRGTFSATYSILHSRDGAAVYVNRYQEPAFFGVNEANNDIQHYSRKIGESPRITRMPHRADFPTGILASWGKVELEPLDEDSIKTIAEGRPPTTKEYFIDFIGDFNRSAKEGLPIYRVSGGPGFVWIASFNQKGRGTLRLSAVDASALAPTTTPKLQIETEENRKAQDAKAITTNQPSREEAEKEPVDEARIDAQRAHEDAENARDEPPTGETFDARYGRW
jgi:hypothetical protein